MSMQRQYRYLFTKDNYKPGSWHVPTCVNKGVIGSSPSLTVYVMDKVPGITYIEVPLATLRCAPWQE